MCGQENFLVFLERKKDGHQSLGNGGTIGLEYWIRNWLDG